MTKRIHESVALSAVLAVSFTLHFAWIANVLVYRVPEIATLFSVLPEVGPVSGLYTCSIGSFLCLFLLSLLLAKGRDLSHWRTRTLWFFMASVILFLLMTMPVVYQVGIVVE